MASTIKSNTIDTVDNTALTIKQNDTTAITVDTSQNVFVKTTGTGSNIGVDSSSTGYYLRDGGQFRVARDNSQPIIANRLNGDGVIIDCRKDGTTVGQIGADASSLYIAGTTRGLRFTSSQIKTTDANGNNQDNQYDLGSSTTRFKDFYLGGNIYLGGTGSSNALDDYEEGTFTPTLNGNVSSPSGVTYDSRLGFYTKIGRQVFFTIFVDLQSMTTAPTGNLIITGLPFTSNSTTGFQHSANIGYSDGFSSTDAPQKGYITNNQTRIWFLRNETSDGRSDTSASVDANTLSGNEEMIVSGHYSTS